MKQLEESEILRDTRRGQKPILQFVYISKEIPKDRVVWYFLPQQLYRRTKEMNNDATQKGGFSNPSRPHNPAHVLRRHKLVKLRSPKERLILNLLNKTAKFIRL